MLILDAHVHVYPHYDAARLLSAARRNIARVAPQDRDVTAAIALVERAGTDVFETWRNGERLPSGTHVESLGATVLRLTDAEGRSLAVLAGRQVACRERVEILGLGCRTELPDGVDAATAVDELAAAGAVPVLAWGVGKWLFGRAKVVSALLERFAPDELLLGDTSLRPVFWPEPAPMRRARRAGRRVLAGSDPLPPAGEEEIAGSYVTVLDDVPPPAGSLSEWIRRALRDPSVPLRTAGRRAGIGEFVARMRR